jgi:2',3'-cyclic-nucleotide 2'-phosphodiesterase (5'-nucleotidase family)
MNLIGYDAAAPGQSEFGLGNKILSQRVKEAQFPFVCANIISEKTGKPLFEPMAIRAFQDVKIGIIGIAGPDAAAGFSPDGKAKAKYLGPKKIIKNLLEKNREKIDIVIIISNCGFEYDCSLAEAFAEAVPGIDVIIGGYSNTKLQKPVRINKTIIAQAYKWGLFLGRLDLLISSDAKGKYRIKDFSGKLLPVSEAVPSVTEIDDLLRRYETEIEKAEKSEKTQKKQ